MNNEVLKNIILEVSPNLIDVYEEYIKDNDGEKLLTVFFGAYLAPLFKADKFKLKYTAKLINKCFEVNDESLKVGVHEFFDGMELSKYEKLKPLLNEKLINYLKYLEENNKYFFKRN